MKHIERLGLRGVARKSVEVFHVEHFLLIPLILRLFKHITTVSQTFGYLYGSDYHFMPRYDMILSTLKMFPN